MEEISTVGHSTPSSIIGIVLADGDTEDGVISIGGHGDEGEENDQPIIFGGRDRTGAGPVTDISMIMPTQQVNKSQYSPHSGGLVSGVGQCVSGDNLSGGGQLCPVNNSVVNAGRLQQILLSGGGVTGPPSVTAFPAYNNHSPSQITIENQIQHKKSSKRRSTLTLPSSIAIPIGLAQVLVGGSMVICGSFALRYQSYLFYYGSGLWAGTLAGIAGILGVMATKKGLHKPKWCCGGRRWQIHIFLAAVMLALSTSILAAIFSTSGLIRDTQRDFSKDTDDMTPDESMHEKRKSSGIAINAFLLLFAMLQILLSFCSLGIALRVLCSRAYCSNNGSLLSSDENGSEVTVREILGDGTGPEYEARKDRLLRWLGHQRRHFIGQSNKAIMAAKMGHGQSNGKATFDTRLFPTFIHSSSTMPRNLNQNLSQHQTSTLYRTHHNQHQQYIGHPPPFVIPAPLHNGGPRAIMAPNSGPHSLPLTLPMPMAYPFPAQLVVPIIPLPMRQPRSGTPISIGGGSGGDSNTKNRKRRLRLGGSNKESSSGSSVGGKSRGTSSCGTGRILKNSTLLNGKRKEKKVEKKNEKNKKPEVEITEEEVGKTYTGLDRVVAEDFINNAMNHE